MINSEKFSERLDLIINHYQETASSFSEKIGVQRSSISHILSGRNKPSLDFVMKILSAYPEVELYWLLNGKGTFPPSESQTEVITPQKIASKEVSNDRPKFQEPNSKEKEIERIVIFYKDGTFKNFNHSG